MPDNQLGTIIGLQVVSVTAPKATFADGNGVIWTVDLWSGAVYAPACNTLQFSDTGCITPILSVYSSGLQFACSTYYGSNHSNLFWVSVGAETTVNVYSRSDGSGGCISANTTTNGFRAQQVPSPVNGAVQVGR